MLNFLEKNINKFLKKQKISCSKILALDAMLWILFISAYIIDFFYNNDNHHDDNIVEKTAKPMYVIFGGTFAGLAALALLIFLRTRYYS